MGNDIFFRWNTGDKIQEINKKDECSYRILPVDLMKGRPG